MISCIWFISKKAKKVEQLKKPRNYRTLDERKPAAFQFFIPSMVENSIIGVLMFMRLPQKNT